MRQPYYPRIVIIANMQAPDIFPVDDDEPREPVIVPHAELSVDALQGVVESFVLREGTDYGEKEFSLEQKVEHVMRQLERGEARIVFDPNTGSVGIVVVERPHDRG